jgi:hypothetical protein
MARIVLTDVDVLLADGNTPPVDPTHSIGQYIASITISTPEDVVETTAFGPVGARTRTSGLKDHSIALEFHNDFASGAMEDIIDGIGIGQLANIIIKPTSAAVSATNPAYKADDSGSGATQAGQVLISEWTPLNGAVGELSTVSVTWPVSGQVLRATS